MRYARWLPAQPLQHCIINTNCKLIILDPERADRLELDIENLRHSAGATGVLVFDRRDGKGDGKGDWKGMEGLESVANRWNRDRMSASLKRKIIEEPIGILTFIREIFFTY
jgi:hypothetical protein